MNATPQYTAKVPGAQHWREQIKCQSACPVHTDARGYVRAIAEGDLEKAYLIARGPNPLASMCGRICGAPCEINCRRDVLDKAVSIRALKRYVCEKEGGDVLAREVATIDRIKEQFRKRECAGGEERGVLSSLFEEGAFQRASGEKVAIIGSGPAGLTAAHDLALFGFKPVIFEMESVAAGMMYLGVPEYRLPRALIHAEVEAIKALGVEIKTNVCIGQDVTLQELIETHCAVIIAVGAKKSRPLPIKGAEGRGVIGGVDFLRAVALKRPMAIGENVVVIGGGNVAYDVSRTAVRHEVEDDVSRTALRFLGVNNVHLCCLESREAMLADEIEINEGAEEGIVLHNSLGPDEIILDPEGAVQAVRFKRVLSIFDGEGRFAPVYDEGDTTEIPCDTVLVSIGQSSDFSFVEPERDGTAMTERGTFVLDDAQATTRPGVFVAGDAEHGPKLMIHAIASGKRVARSVYEFVMGAPIRLAYTSLHVPIDGYIRQPGFEILPRQSPCTAPHFERTRSVAVEVERCLDDGKAILEAQRCLDCGVNTIFDSGKCILCGGCADVCPEQCLKLVSFGMLRGDKRLGNLVELLSPASIGEAGAIIKNDDRCTRCGLCAERCPVGAITMERFNFRAVCNGRCENV